MSLDDDGIWLRNLCEHADKTLCKCGIHDSCVDCHHENTSDDDERTCIQKLHDDFHAAEELARVQEAMCEWLAGRATMIERELGKKPTWDSSDDWLKAAREAVERSE